VQSNHYYCTLVGEGLATLALDTVSRRQFRRQSSRLAEWDSQMPDTKEFAKELSALIKRYIDGGCDPQEVADELAREANYVFGHYNLEIFLEKMSKD
jgi:hypothetical protein